jgi:hypothetical protein
LSLLTLGHQTSWPFTEVAINPSHAYGVAITIEPKYITPPPGRYPGRPARGAPGETAAPPFGLLGLP